MPEIASSLLEKKVTFQKKTLTSSKLYMIQTTNIHVSKEDGMFGEELNKTLHQLQKDESCSYLRFINSVGRSSFSIHGLFLSAYHANSMVVTQFGS